MEKFAVLWIVFTLSVAASAQRQGVPIKMSWDWMDDSVSKPVIHDGSLVVSFGCGPVEAGDDGFPEGDPSKKDTKWTKLIFQKCGEEEVFYEIVNVYKYAKEIGVNFDTADALCKEDTCILKERSAAIEHKYWNGHPGSYVMVQHDRRTESGWFIVLDKHVAISLVLYGRKYSPDEWKAFSNSLVVTLH